MLNVKNFLVIVLFIPFLFIAYQAPLLSELEKHRDDFQAKVPGISMTFLQERLPLSFEDRGWTFFEGGSIGTCNFPFLGKAGAIRIDPKFWGQATDWQKKGLMWHELGHCACTLGHTVELSELEAGNWFLRLLERWGLRTKRQDHLYLADGCPKSLMFPLIPSDSCLQKHWDLYETEIAQQCRPFKFFDFHSIFNRRSNEL